MFVLGEKEVVYLKKIFASFGYKDADIKKVEEGYLALSSFAVNTVGDSIKPFETESLLHVGDYPHFCILSKKGDVLRLDFCMNLLNVADYVVGLYMDDSYEGLGVYFIKDEEKVPETVEFGAILHQMGESIFVENFGTVNSGEIFDRAVANVESNLPFKQCFKDYVEGGHIWLDEFHLNNIMDLRLCDDGFDTSADSFRFATSIEELAAFMDALKGDKVTFRAIINTHEVKLKTAADAVEEFEHSQNYWRSIYESHKQ